MTQTHSSTRARLILATLVFLAFSFLTAGGRAQYPQCASVSVSQSQLVGASSNTAIVSFTLDGAAGPYGVNVAYEATDYLSPDFASVFISPGGSGGSFPIPITSQNDFVPAGTVQTDTISCYTAYQTGTDPSATITVTPLLTTVTLSPSSVVGGSSQTVKANFTLSAPAGGDGLNVGLVTSPGSLPYTPDKTINNVNAFVSPGDNTGSFTIYVNNFTVSTQTPYSVTAFTGYEQNGTPAILTLLPVPPPTVNPPGLGHPDCKLGCASPINISNGNTWIEQRDYSLPGLGGGLELARTWNSHWQDATPVSVLGMFGHSWRSTYEERFSFPDGNTVMYWRADGAGWTFTYNRATQLYSLASPLNEHASLTYNSIAGQYTLAFADGSQRIFNQPGYLTALIDRNGNQTTVTYDGSIRITQVTDAAGRSITFSYNDPVNTSQATTAQDATGVFATYVYDSNARLTQVTYADNSQLNFAYDANSSITSVTDLNGKLLEAHTYDSAHDGLTSSRAYGADQVTLTYNSVGQTQLTDSMGNITTYGYQTIGGRNFANSVSGPGCASCGGRGNQTLTYDAFGNVATSTDALNNTTSFTYDGNGNVLTKSVQLNPTTTFTWTYTYNQFQEVLTAQDPLGKTTTNTYDAKGNLLTTTTPPPGGTGSGFTTTFDYDTKGELTTVTDPLNHATTITYTAAGLIATTKDAQNNTTTFAYDARGNRLSSKDALNNTTNFTYDVMDRLTKITNPDNSTTQFAYDTRGRRISVTDANSKTTSYGYDDADRLTSVTDAASNLTAYGYDTENHLQAITDASNRVTSFTYDPLGRVTDVTFPSGLSESYNYDAVGNLLTKTDRKNQAVTYAYDNLYRLASKTYPDSTAVDYTYDALSRLTQAVDPTGTYGFTYDNLGRLTGTTTNYSFLTGRTLTESYGYDAASNRTSFTDPESGVTNYTYDTLNRLATLKDFSNGTSGFSYDALGRRTALTRPNGVSTTYSYDTLSRLLQALHQKGSTLVEGAAYTYDAAGNRTSRVETTPGKHGTGTQTDAFSYDAIYELTQAATNGNTTDLDTYDAVGNRLTDWFGGTYNYNSSNELTSYPVYQYTWTYDNNGNTTSETVGANTTTFNWDFENRLTSVALPGTGGTVSFKYDPFGRRIEKISPTAGTTIYAYDGDNRIEDLSSTGTATARYTQGLGIDEPLEVYEGRASYYYHADGLGSIVALTSSRGSAVNTYFEYNTFGADPDASETVANPFRFTAREWDSETSLYYYRARYYDSLFGRFISEDPIQFKGGVNFYNYVGNRPTGYTDPTGLKECDNCTKAAPLPSSSPKCDSYGNELYLGVSLKCFCKCAGDSSWSQKVRGCLACEHDKGTSPYVAHDTCYRAAGLAGAPWLTLTECYSKCYVGRGKGGSK